MKTIKFKNLFCCIEKTMMLKKKTLHSKGIPEKTFILTFGNKNRAKQIIITKDRILSY